MRRMVPLVLICAVASCAPVQTASTYSREQMGRAATVMKGSIVTMRPVTISGTQSGVGAGAGAIAGGAAGSYVGGGARTNIIGAVGGAVVGGVAGAVAEQALTQAGAIEFIVQQENGQTIAVVQTNEDALKEGDQVLILRSDRVRIVRNTALQPH